MPASTPASKKATPRATAHAAASKPATAAVPTAAASKSAVSGTDKKAAATSGGGSAAAAHPAPKSSAAMKTTRKSEGSSAAGRRASNSSTGTSGSVEKSKTATKTGATPRASAVTQKKAAAAAVSATDTGAKKEKPSAVEQQSSPVPASAPASDKASSPADHPVAVAADDGNIDVSFSSPAGVNEDISEDTRDAVASGSALEDGSVAHRAAPATASTTPLICIFGPPCSGKGTLSELLKQQLGLEHMCTGNLLREAAKEQGEDSEIGGIIKSGGLVPDAVVVDLLTKALEGSMNRKGVILDGFPRNAEQVKLMNKTQFHPGMVLVLKVPSEVLFRRMAARRVDPETGQVFDEGSEPQDEEQRKRLVQRDDDKPEILQKRLDEYTERADSIFSSFKDIGGISQDDLENTKRPDTEEQQPDQQQRFKIVGVDGDRDVKQIFEDVSSLLRTSFPTLS